MDVPVDDHEVQHVFDQTNGLVPMSDRDRGPDDEQETRRRRGESSALAYGMWAAGNQ